MIDHGKRNVIGILVDAVDYEAAVERIAASARAGRGMAVSGLAVHGVMEGSIDAEQRYRLNRLDLVVPDGQPVRWALNRLHGVGLRDRVRGPTLMLELCARAAADGQPVFLYGSTPTVLLDLRENLQARFPGLRIAGIEPSRFRRLDEGERDDIVSRIRASGARIVFCGLGCPRQEVWAFELREALSVPIVAVGAAFDFHAGHLAQAPRFMQRWGLEWLHRLAQEPRRLWRRYLRLNPAFVLRVIAQRIRLRRFDPETGIEPVAELRFG